MRQILLTVTLFLCAFASAKAVGLRDVPHKIGRCAAVFSGLELIARAGPREVQRFADGIEGLPTALEQASDQLYSTFRKLEDIGEGWAAELGEEPVTMASLDRWQENYRDGYEEASRELLRIALEHSDPTSRLQATNGLTDECEPFLEELKAFLAATSYSKTK